MIAPVTRFLPHVRENKKRKKDQNNLQKNYISEERKVRMSDRKRNQAQRSNIDQKPSTAPNKLSQNQKRKWRRDFRLKENRQSTEQNFSAQNQSARPVSEPQGADHLS
jgi:hypothetical protein